jgi:cyclic beta-1,2-glucan synthetase
LQLPGLKRLSEKAVRAVEAGLQTENGLDDDLIFWAGTLPKIVAEFTRDTLATDGPESLGSRFEAIATRAEEMALGMDFAFLLDPDRKLLSIGYSLSDNRLDANCYDLLASEARLASLFAIAKGDIPTRHWFRLGRTATPLGDGSALISWSGSMFEYLMPSLVMRAPAGSLLEQTNRLVVARQFPALV